MCIYVWWTFFITIIHYYFYSCPCAQRPWQDEHFINLINNWSLPINTTQGRGTAALKSALTSRSSLLVNAEGRRDRSGQSQRPGKAHLIGVGSLQQASSFYLSLCCLGERGQRRASQSTMSGSYDGYGQANRSGVPLKPRPVSWAVHTGGRLALQELHWNCSVWADA